MTTTPKRLKKKTDSVIASRSNERPAPKRLAKRSLKQFVHSFGRSGIVLAAALGCLLLTFTGMTYSYFSAKDHIVNEFDISKLTFEIEEPEWDPPDTPVKPGDILPKDPQIVNTGQIPFVVRARIQEVWTPKDTPEAPDAAMENYVRYFAANTDGDLADGVHFLPEKLLEILAGDKGKTADADHNFALEEHLTPNITNPNKEYWDQAKPGNWYRGSGLPTEEGKDPSPSPWFYYDQIVDVGERTEPLFRAVTIRTAEDYLNRDDYESDEAYKKALAEYNAKLAKYNLDIYVYAEPVQAEPFAWKDAYGEDLPVGWDAEHWGMAQSGTGGTTEEGGEDAP